MSSPKTVAEKILARASGEENIKPGDYITASIDFAMAHESFALVLKGMMSAAASTVFDPQKIAIVLDQRIRSIVKCADEIGASFESCTHPGGNEE